MAVNLRGYGLALISLDKAIMSAGGEITYDNLKGMSGEELVKLLGTNNISFVYNAPPPKNDL